MPNSFYNISGTPAQGAAGDSASIRAEFTALQTAFDKLPTLAVASAGFIVRLNAAGTGLEAVSLATLGLSAASSYDIQNFHSGVTTASQVVQQLMMVRPVTFGVNMAGSSAVAGVAATASTVFDVAKNAVNFGTITFAALATSGTFIAAVPPAFAIGDILTVTGPAVADVTLANISFILAGQI